VATSAGTFRTETAHGAEQLLEATVQALRATKQAAGGRAVAKPPRPRTTACTSMSLDHRTQVITLLAEATSPDTDLEACIASAIARGKSGIVVDLSAVEEVEPRVVAALMRGNRRLGWRNGRLSLVGPTGDNGGGERNLLNTSFDVCASRQQAVSRVRNRLPRRRSP
jgi:hypothetical protein